MRLLRQYRRDRQDVPMSESNILAIVAIVMSVASLAWQAATWLWSGAAVEAWITLSHDRVTVVAYNSGRTATTITRIHCWSNEYGDVRVDGTPLPESDLLPYHIAGGGNGSWHYKLIRPSFEERGGWDYGDYGGGLDRSRGPGFPGPDPPRYLATLTVGRDKKVWATSRRS